MLLHSLCVDLYFKIVGLRVFTKWNSCCKCLKCNSGPMVAVGIRYSGLSLHWVSQEVIQLHHTRESYGALKETSKVVVIWLWGGLARKCGE